MSAKKGKKPQSSQQRIEFLRAELAKLEARLREEPSAATDAGEDSNLRDIHEKYSLLFSGLSDAVLVCDLESGRIVDVNEPACLLYGYTRDQLTQRTVVDLSAEPEQTRTALRALQSGGGGHVPLRLHRHRDGTILPIEIAGGPFSYNGRRYACGVYRDLRPSQRVENTLRGLTERLEVLHAIDQAILDSRPNAEVANLALEQIRRSIPCRRASVLEYDLDRGRAALTAVLTDGETALPAGLEFPVDQVGPPPEFLRGQTRIVEMLEPTERALPTERTLYAEGIRAILNIPILYRERLVGALNIGFDRPTTPDPRAVEIARELTDRLALAFHRRRAERALLESEQWHRGIFEHARDAIFILDAHGAVVDANSAASALTGLDREALGGLDVRKLLGPAGDELDSALWDRIVQGERPLLDARIVRADGSARQVEISFSQILAERGPYVLTAARDISARKRAEADHARLEAQILHTQKLESLGVLAGGIAHDFNNLLTGIMGNASLALLNLSPTAPARAYLEQIEIGSQRAADLCKQMLAYSGRGKFLVQPLDLSRVVEEMAHLLEVSISKKAVLKYRLESNLSPIEADVTQVRQVIMNLITNASDAIGERSGIITLTTGAMQCDREYLKSTYLTAELPEGGYAYIEVSDTGRGMDKETMSRIFDPFFTTKFTGRGLGLAAVLGIVRGHRGMLKVYSEPGRGTSFKVLFPLSNKELAAIATTRPDRATGLRGTGTILVVDDEETVRALAVHTLEAFGFQALTANDGGQAVELFAERGGQGIDLVLLDLTMPHMGGEETFRELRRINPDVRVLLSSGYTEQEATDRFAGKNLAGFIQKPYRATALLERIGAILQG
jgi:PAS domain S-box-containing protein